MMSEKIFIKGARVNNLKNIDVVIPKNKIISVTGVSGSGKSSLAINTLHAEGQRRYIESLSSYARQFLGKIDKPDVSEITGICPAIALEQKNGTKNPRSTVGTVSEIYEYLKLLYARIGKIYIGNEEFTIHKVDDVIKFCFDKFKKKEISLLIKKKIDKKKLIFQGYSEVLLNKKVVNINDLEDEYSKVGFIIIDTLKSIEDNKSRLFESIEIAKEQSNRLHVMCENKFHEFLFRHDNNEIKIIEPSVNLFSFNNPYGACKNCQGYGDTIGIDDSKVIPDKSLSVYEGAVKCWSGTKLSKWKTNFVNKISSDFPIHRPYKDLSKQEKEILWNGTKDAKGINTFFSKLEKKKYKIQNRVLLSRYTGKTQCNVCNGSRLREESNYVKIDGKTITELSNLSLKDLSAFFKKIVLNDEDLKTSERLLKEIRNRIDYLLNVGLSYLSLSRKSNTLSGGEFQRLNLANSLASSLIGTMYILDEPSIGLHAKDTHKLMEIITKLKEIGNTVIIVEHDKDIILNSDYIIDIGPKAGSLGGKVVFAGEKSELYNCNQSLTLDYLTNKKIIKKSLIDRKSDSSIRLKNVNVNNIKSQNFNIPLGLMCTITGVSGSGKSSLLKKVIEPGLKAFFESGNTQFKECESFEILNNNYKNVEYLSQNPIGKSSRSNPVTYLKAYDDIRNLFARQPLSKQRKYKSGFFSFNIAGGRCEECKGEGEINIEMQFMADVKIKCEKCNGKKFKDEVLDIQFNSKNINDILDMTVSEAIEFFKEYNEDKIVKKLDFLNQVGLEYVKLGQSSSSLSGGEAQRVKLAYFLSKSNKLDKTIFLFDEPTTGLHFEDIKKLLISFDKLIELGNSIICIEHNLDIINNSNWIIDLGPDGGSEGGEKIFSGKIEKLINCKNSHTGQYLKKHLIETNQKIL